MQVPNSSETSILTTKAAWSSAWEKHLSSYLSAMPRAALCIQGYFKNQVGTVLEVAGGSCTDSRFLAKVGYQATGSDFDDQTIQRLQALFPADRLRYSVEDAFSLSFADGSFDLVFHNGFFVLFVQDSDVQALLKEQARTSNRYIAFFVHNHSNSKLRSEFAAKAKTDPLYRIRFFDVQSVQALVHSSGVPIKRMSLLKFGGPIDRLFGLGLVRAWAMAQPALFGSLLFKAYQLLPWSKAERIVCILELDK